MGTAAFCRFGSDITTSSLLLWLLLFTFCHVLFLARVSYKWLVLVLLLLFWIFLPKLLHVVLFDYRNQICRSSFLLTIFLSFPSSPLLPFFISLFTHSLIFLLLSLTLPRSIVAAPRSASNRAWNKAVSWNVLTFEIKFVANLNNRIIDIKCSLVYEIVAFEIVLSCNRECEVCEAMTCAALRFQLHVARILTARPIAASQLSLQGFFARTSDFVTINFFSVNKSLTFHLEFFFKDIAGHGVFYLSWADTDNTEVGSKFSS